MYRCQITGRLSERNVPMNKLVVETRDRIYTRFVKNEETRQWEEIEVGRGWEIVREINVSQAGKDLWDSWNPEERAVFLKTLH